MPLKKKSGAKKPNKKPVKKVAKKSSRKVIKKVAKKPIKKSAKKVFKKKVAPKKTSKPSVKKPVAPKREGKKVAVVTHWFGNISVAILKLSVAVSVGDRLRFYHGDKTFDETISSMQMDHAPIQQGAKGKEVGIKVSGKAYEGSEVYRL